MDNVRIYDATLYGGGQSPGASLNIEEKLEIARLLEQMRVEVIQAGFPREPEPPGHSILPVEMQEPLQFAVW